MNQFGLYTVFWKPNRSVQNVTSVHRFSNSTYYRVERVRKSPFPFRCRIRPPKPNTPINLYVCFYYYRKRFGRHSHYVPYTYVRVCITFKISVHLTRIFAPVLRICWRTVFLHSLVHTNRRCCYRHFEKRHFQKRYIPYRSRSIKLVYGEKKRQRFSRHWWFTERFLFSTRTRLVYLFSVRPQKYNLTV